MSFVWTCICCEKPVKIIYDGDDEKSLYPNLVGGTFELHFGYGSKHDNLVDGDVFQGCICDDCADKKKHLMRSVLIQKTTTWIV